MPNDVPKHTWGARTGAGVALISGVVLSLSCSDASDPSAVLSPDVPQPQFTHVGPPPPIMTSPFAVPADAGLYEVVSIADVTFVRITLSGSISLTQASGWCGGGSPPPYPYGSYGPEGDPGGGFGLGVTIGNQGISLPAAQNYTALGEYAGVVRVRRTAGGTSCAVGGTNIAFTDPVAMSSQELLVEGVIPFTVEGSPGFVSPPGQDVTFTVSSQFTITGHEWFFRANDTLPEPLGPSLG